MSEYNYDEYYQERNYFGKASKEVMNYFNQLDKSLTILDLGCGQGRDSIALGRLGFKVKGVDVSRVGIEQMNAIAEQEKLDVHGVVEDYKKSDDISRYDVILMDSMFHFYKNDIESETNDINNILMKLKVGGRLVLTIQENEFRIKYLKRIIQESKIDLVIEYETKYMFQEFSTLYYMISIVKL